MIAGLAAAAVCGLILGEYDLTGWTPIVGGAIVGIAVGEVVMFAARITPRWLAATAAASAAGGYGWAMWISSGRGVAPIKAGAWLGLVLAAVTAGAWILAPGRRSHA